VYAMTLGLEVTLKFTCGQSDAADQPSGRGAPSSVTNMKILIP